MTKPEWTHLYLCIAFWLSLASVLVKLGALAIMDYPRSIEYSRGEDAFSILLGAVMIAFIWWLAWG